MLYISFQEEYFTELGDSVQCPYIISTIGQQQGLTTIPALLLKLPLIFRISARRSYSN
jgi:hypothetical protein